MAQVHTNKPLPIFAEKPSHTIEDDLTGWSYSKDGQWISAENTIPIRAISTDEDAYDTPENRLGMDNIEELRLYPVLYGQDTLVALVKLYESGSYKLDALKKGWRSSTEAYYFLFDASELKRIKKADSLMVVKIDLRDYGRLHDVSPRHLLDELTSRVMVRSETDRQLVLLTENGEDNTTYFQLASMSSVFEDVEGVLKDFTLRAETLYGTPALLDYLHYAYSTENFYRFFSLPSSLNIKGR